MWSKENNSNDEKFFRKTSNSKIDLVQIFTEIFIFCILSSIIQIYSLSEYVHNF